MAKVKKHCRNCSCGTTPRKKRMHGVHVYVDTPSYFMNERGIRKAIYLCKKTVSRKELCWESREEVINA